MLISTRAKTLLQKGNLQEQRNKEFTLQLTTSLLLVLASGFLAGFISCKSLADPLSNAISEQKRVALILQSLER